MPIKDYSTTPANNNASPPNGAPEGMPPNAVNDTMRQMMADTRSFYNQIEWRDWGYTPSYVSATSFTIPGDATAVAKVGRRVRLVGSGGMGTKYGVIATSVYSTLTTVTVTLDSGSLDSSLTNILFGLDQANKPFSLSSTDITGVSTFGASLIDDADAATARATLGLGNLATQNANLSVGLNHSLTTVASAATPDIWTGTGNVINYTGTTTTTGFAAAPQAGASRKLICAGAVQFTNGANLIVPGGANYTSSAGDQITVTAVTTTQFRLEVVKADGTPVVATSQDVAKIQETILGSAAAFIDCPLPTGYNFFKIAIDGLSVATNDVALIARFTQDNFSTIITAANSYSYGIRRIGGGTYGGLGGIANQTEMRLNDSGSSQGLSNTAGREANAIIEVFNCNRTGTKKSILTRGGYANAGGLYAVFDSWGVLEANTNPVNGLRLSLSTGNFNTNTRVSVWGFK